MLFNMDKVTQNTFRLLVLGIFISIAYDLFWFSLKSLEYQQDLKADAGLEKNLRLFSLYMSYISFFVRLVMGLVYWKDSLDFDNIMQGRRMEGAGPSIKVQNASPKNARQDYIREQSPTNNRNINLDRF